MELILDSGKSSERKRTIKNEKGENIPIAHPKTTFRKKLIIKHNKKNIKLKLRTKKYLITYVDEGRKNYQKILQALPSNIQKVDLKQKKSLKK